MVTDDFGAVDLLGWSAASLTVATFWNRNPLWMRVFAIGTNIAFIAYGLGLALPPVLFLHLVLLPINAWRLIQGLTEPVLRP